MFGDTTYLLTYGILGLLALALACLAGVLIKLAQHTKEWLQAHTTAAQRDVLHKIAAEAVAYAAQAYKDFDGDVKLDRAVGYVKSHLPAGITITTDQVRGAIEKAYTDMVTRWAAAQTETVHFLDAPRIQLVDDPGEKK